MKNILLVIGILVSIIFFLRAIYIGYQLPVTADTGLALLPQLLVFIAASVVVYFVVRRFLPRKR